VFVVLSLALLEGYFRHLHTPSVDLVRFVFIHEMSNERWDYLMEEHLGEDMLKVIGSEMVPGREGSADAVIEPEKDRPPYDRIRKSYRVAHNPDGFRDRPFIREKAAPMQRIVILGDSISYGKGLTPKQRYGDLLQAQAPKHVQIDNLSYPACGTVCMVAYLKEFLLLKPDLVIVQPSGNDVDHTMGRAARGSTMGILSSSLRWLLRSRALQVLSFSLYGDAKSGQIDGAITATKAFYAPQLKKLFDTCLENNIKVVVMSFPGSNDAWYGGHVSQTCKERSDTCLGAIDLDLHHPERWVSAWTSFSEATEQDLPDWLTETASQMDLEAGVLAQLFPFRRFFMDIVHPNRVANMIAANQLQTFLQKNWPGWSAAPH
jgi:hypothetical protein